MDTEPQGQTLTECYGYRLSVTNTDCLLHTLTVCRGVVRSKKIWSKFNFSIDEFFNNKKMQQVRLGLMMNYCGKLTNSVEIN